MKKTKILVTMLAFSACAGCGSGPAISDSAPSGDTVAPIGVFQRFTSAVPPPHYRLITDKTTVDITVGTLPDIQVGTPLSVGYASDSSGKPINDWGYLHWEKTPSYIVLLPCSLDRGINYSTLYR